VAVTILNLRIGQDSASPESPELAEPVGTRGPPGESIESRDCLEWIWVILTCAKPEDVKFVDQLAKTRSGKIMRRLLKARAQGLPEGDISTLEE
jgi:hypothetical protein